MDKLGAWMVSCSMGRSIRGSAWALWRFVRCVNTSELGGFDESQLKGSKLIKS